MVSVARIESSLPRAGACWRELLAASLAAVLVPTTAVQSGWPACEKDRITNLHYECVSPGAQCGATKYCRDVSGFLWKDCKCKDGKAAITYRVDGAWGALALGPLEQGMPVPFDIQAIGGDQLQVYDDSDLNETGDVVISQTMEEVDALVGAPLLQFGFGPPEAIPVTIQALNLQLAPFTIHGDSTGPNMIDLAAGGELVEGVYDSIMGTIRFDTPVPCTISNDLYPGGRDMILQPIFESVGGDMYAFMPGGAIVFPECFGGDDFDRFPVGSGLHGIDGWKGWDDDAAFDAAISDAQSRSAPSSVSIADASDLVHESCLDEGVWSFSAWQYIPADYVSGGSGQFRGSHFLLLNTYADGGPYHWSVDLQFDSNDGMLKVYYGNGLNTIDLPYETDRWVKIEAIIDLESDWTQVYYDDELITEYSWTGGITGDGGGSNSVAAVDLYANGSSPIYYDDLRLEPCLPGESFEYYGDGTDLHGIAGWKGWDNDPTFSAPTTSEQAHAGAHSVRIEAAADLVREHHTAGTGRWSYSAWQYIPSDFSSNAGGQFAGTYFVLLNTYNDGGPYNWSVQMQFDSNDGMLKVFHGDGLNTINVPYETDRWAKIEAIVDLEEDWTRIYYDDELITEYSWTGGVLGDGGGALDIAAVDLFANGSSRVFYDDLMIEIVEPPPCPADLNEDETVNVFDLLLLLEAWGPGGGPADLNDDDVVNVFDLLLLLEAWGACG